MNLVKNSSLFTLGMKPSILNMKTNEWIRSGKAVY